MIKPNYEDFERLCSQGNLIPIATEIPGDLDTPLSALLKIDDSQSSFLLESVEGGQRWARYSFLGSDPRAIIKSRNGRVEIHAGETVETIVGVSDSTSLVKRIMEKFRPARVPDLPAFFGGAVGFFSYDVVRDFERIPDLGKPGPGFYDAWFMVTRDLVVFDNFLHKILLITTVSLDEASSAKKAYAEGCARLENLEESLRSRCPQAAVRKPQPNSPAFSPNMSQGAFEQMVHEAKRHIKAGDIIQVVLSQRFRGDGLADPLSVYRGLRMINPSPYMFFLRMGDEVLAGASPEVMVQDEKRRGRI